MSKVAPNSSGSAGDRGIQAFENIFALRLATIVAFLVAIPDIIARLMSGAGNHYLGFVYNTDDQMVYAAWMRQAMQGKLLFDNRFTTDKQAGQTVHLYFFLLGQFARILGIANTMNLSRIILSAAFTYLVYRFVARIEIRVFTRKLATFLTIFGGGIGFLVWHDFGIQLVLPNTLWMSPITLGRLPTDIWQPEGFVLSSLLTNTLFAVSLCLIILFFWSVLEVTNPEKRAKWIVIGGVSYGLLMNIHSYDVLWMGFVLIGLLATSLKNKTLTAGWLFATIAMILCVIPGALWYWHVISIDPVFLDRAQTPTFSPNFRALFVGYLPFIAISGFGIWKRLSEVPEKRRERLAGFVLIAAAYAFLFVTAKQVDDYSVSLPIWAVCFVAILGGLYLSADDESGFNLILSWAVVSLIAPYFPELFQRKLTMGASIPWGILSAYGVVKSIGEVAQYKRNFAIAFFILLFSGSSIRWMLRQVDLLRQNVSETTVQPAFLSANEQRIVNYLRPFGNTRTVVVSMPGIPAPTPGPDPGTALIDSYSTPIVPDLNPILSGLDGVYTFAGHWSETPDYLEKRGECNAFYYQTLTDQERIDFLHRIGARFVVIPNQRAFPGMNMPDLSHLGSIVVPGTAYELVEIH